MKEGKVLRVRNVGISNAEKREEKEKERDEEEFEEETLSHECFFKEEEEENEASVVRRVKAVGEKGEMGPKKLPSRCKPIFSLKKSLSASTHNELLSFPPASSSSSFILDPSRVDSTFNHSDGRLDGEIYELLYHTLGEENVCGGNWGIFGVDGDFVVTKPEGIESPAESRVEDKANTSSSSSSSSAVGDTSSQTLGSKKLGGGGSFITNVDKSLSTMEEAGIAPSDASSGASSSSSSSSSSAGSLCGWRFLLYCQVRRV